MLTEKDYCDYETCVALKEIGYPLTSKEVRYEDKVVFVPGVLLYSAQKWLREKHNLHIEITYSPSCWTCKIYDLKEWDYIKGFTFIESYEDALAEGIKEAVKILKENGYGKF